MAAAGLLALLALIVAVLIGSGSPAADQSDPSSARPIADWFSVLKDGPTPDAAALEAVRDAARIDTTQPPVETARIAASSPDGHPIIISGQGGIVCILHPGYGGGCSGGDAIREAPVIVQGVGQEGPVDTTYFRALVGDGIDSLAVTMASGEVINVDVRNNVAFAELKGRVDSWSWLSPDGEPRSQSVTE